MRVTKKSVFFWAGIYSQWHYSPFNTEGINFVTAEQYMMYKKAMLFGDEDIADAIMRTQNPKEQKELGRKVRNFNAEVWNKNAIDIVTEGNYQKFTQNPDMLKVLIQHKDLEIVEASPHDKIWGIGLHYSNLECDDKSKWKGTNWLGISIMNARKRIIEEMK